MEIQDLRNQLERRKGQKMQVEKDLQNLQISIRQQTRELHRFEQAKEIIRTVGMKTQEQLSFHISDITSLALEAVFADPYELLVQFVKRRDKSECDLLFKRNEVEMDPLTASGVGAVDVASFALRIASWSMMNPKTRPTIILDEPMKHLSVDNQPAASEMIKELSQKLGLQFIIITHENALTTWADKTFEVGIKKGISYLK
ncbi:MAG TPA: hypothetical protein VMX17_16835 [Candidatus Glassbacteria bacterium]|nr:hypothetical protein [Candidatus Glassbacteria bacterium]